MGLLKKLKKIGKKILKGAKKVFKKVGKFVGKIASSKWGKALLIAGAVVTGGIAIYGALQGVAGATSAGATFMGKFAAGAKGMLSALASPIATGKEMLGGVGAVADATGGMAAMGGATGEAAMTGAQGAATMGQPAGWASVGQTVAGGAGTGAGAGGGGAGILSKVAGGAMDFAKSAGGGKMLYGAMEGYAAGKTAEEDRKWKEKQARYYDDAWKDPSRVDQYRNAISGGFNPVQFKNPGAPPMGTGSNNRPLSPELVAGYARSGG